MTNALEAYSKRVIVDTPQKSGQAYVDDDFGLPKIFEGGSFAEARHVAVLPEALLSGLISPLVNYVWNKQQVVLIKVDEKSLGSNPCPNRGGGISGISDDAVWCDANGVAHVLMVWPKDTRSSLDVYGVDQLANYTLSIELLRASADRSQARRGFLPDADDIEYTKDLLLNEDLDDPSSFVGFTTPVCDVRKFDWNDVECTDDSGDDDLVSLHLSTSLYHGFYRAEKLTQRLRYVVSA